MSTPHVYTIIIAPEVEMSASGFTPINRDDSWFDDNAMHLCEIAKKISSRPPLLLCGRSATKMKICNVLNHFMCKDVDKPGEHEIRLTNFYNKNYPVEEGDFVFLFFASHGYRSLGSPDISGKLMFLSNSDYANRLKKGEEYKAFCPDTRYWGFNKAYTEHPVKTYFKITQTQYLASLAQRTSGYPRITTTATSDTVKIPKYDYNNLNYVNLMGEITFPVRAGTYLKSENESSQFTYFHSYLDTKTNIITYFHLTPTTTQQVFGYLPPQNHVPISFLFQSGKSYQFNSYDLRSILQNTNTNVFSFISACHSGEFAHINPKISPFSTCTIWTSCDTGQLSWANDDPSKGPIGSNFIVSLKELFSRFRLVDYREAKDFLSSEVGRMAIHQKQTPQFNTIGSSEFDGFSSHHPFFPLNGNINP